MKGENINVYRSTLAKPYIQLQSSGLLPSHQQYFHPLNPLGQPMPESQLNPIDLTSYNKSHKHRDKFIREVAACLPVETQ